MAKPYLLWKTPPLRRRSRGYFSRAGDIALLEAHNPAEALDLFDAHAGNIQLLLTDVMMPQMTGPQLASELRRRNPGVRVVYMSGYPDQELASPNEMFLSKPFNPAGLSQMVRKALDGAVASKRINGH